MKYNITSLSQLEDFAKDFAKSLQRGDKVGLSGNLGAGKTTFVKFLAKNLGIEEVVISPTYIYEQVYNLPKSFNQIDSMHHLDLYRIKSNDDFESLGFDLSSADLSLIEWIENVPSLENQATKFLNFYTDNQERFVEVYNAK